MVYRCEYIYEYGIYAYVMIMGNEHSHTYAYESLSSIMTVYKNDPMIFDRQRIDWKLLA